MRITKLFQIYDNVANTVVGPIISAPHQASAIRNFTDLLNDPKTTLASHPDDYKLLCIGEQDEETGIIVTWTTTDVATGTQWRIMNDQRVTPLAAD